MDGGLGSEAGEAVRVEKAHGLSHSEIMPGFPVRENAKTPGKTATNPSFLAATYPHALEKSQNNEQFVCVEMRNKFGRTILAERALPIIEQALHEGKHVLIESLYAWWDYTFLKERLGERFKTLAIYAPPALRYARLAVRPERPYSEELAHSRDYAQIESLQQAGPIAMADWTIQSTGTKEELHAAVDALIQVIVQGGVGK